MENYTVCLLILLRWAISLTLSSQLPDGRVIKLGPERFQAPEALFQPHLVDVEAPGMAG